MTPAEKAAASIMAAAFLYVELHWDEFESWFAKEDNAMTKDETIYGRKIIRRAWISLLSQSIGE